MDQVFTVTSLFNALILVVGWSIRQELKHIGEALHEVKESTTDAHRRIDALLSKG
jgi:hypothetical protein